MNNSKPKNPFEKICIILVEPQNPGNVGMVCRAMKNMGITDLRLVKGCETDHPEARKFAVSAADILERARRFDTLTAALENVEVSIGTTRRHGKYRQEIFSPEEIVTKLKPLLESNRAALVFGREDSGLTTDELSICSWHATIPSSPDYGSLNLAQSVLVFCYELFKNLGEEGEGGREIRSMAEAAESEALYGHMEEILLKIGFLNPQNPAHLMRTLRRIFGRSGLDSREVAVLRGMMTQIDWASSRFQGKKGK